MHCGFMWALSNYQFSEAKDSPLYSPNGRQIACREGCAKETVKQSTLPTSRVWNSLVFSLLPKVNPIDFPVLADSSPRDPQAPLQTALPLNLHRKKPLIIFLRLWELILKTDQSIIWD